MNEYFNIIFVVFIFILLFSLGLGHAANAIAIEDIEKSNQEKSDSLVIMCQVSDSLKKRIEILEHTQKENYSEQCRVDSIQDAYLQRLNIRTAPLLNQ